MAEIDASGMRHVMREAIRIASSVPKGMFSFSQLQPDGDRNARLAGRLGRHDRARNAPGHGGGGLTSRMLSLDVSPIGAHLDPHAAAETMSFVLSAFGKRIL